ncbi:hypothetical protein DYU11_20990 [Fibrisoma montanum]|uniref:Holin n=1 Tax=Fibrisoma montanum TaxID=2305895 RepID=A0A418M4D8_9BACT|nr:hypothetical protein [Fibrisoma montanum]RIV20524.1 hypothetical protein DYU11_20990 [Fibrisoma montanum]
MDATTLIPEILKVSPFAAVLVFCLYTLWKSNEKKDQTLLDVVQKHTEKQDQQQEKLLTAFNQNSLSNVQLAQSVDNWGKTVDQRLTSLEASQKARNGRTLPARKTTTPTA